MNIEYLYYLNKELNNNANIIILNKFLYIILSTNFYIILF